MRIRSLIIILTLCMAIALLSVSCNAEVSHSSEELVSVSFENGTSKSLSPSLETFNVDSFYWYYTATKKDGSNLVNGQTSDQVAVKSGKGLAQVSGFSQGQWEFTLYAYTGENRQGLVYKGTSDVVTLKNSSTNEQGYNTVSVVVSPVTTDGDGTLAINVGAIKAASTNPDYSGAISVDLTYVKRVDGSQAVEVSNVEHASSGFSNGVYSVSLAPGAYTVTLRFNLPDSKYTTSTVVVMVYSNMTTTIGGSMTGTVSSGS